VYAVWEGARTALEAIMCSDHGRYQPHFPTSLAAAACQLLGLALFQKSNMILEQAWWTETAVF